MAVRDFIPIGQRFGLLVILSEAPRNGKAHRHIYAQCDCGNLVRAIFPMVKQGRTRSCGCGRIKHAHASGEVTSPTYRTWRAMKSRCLNPKGAGYINYGGRGISICERWLSFPNFLADMGERPDGKTLDRFPNVNGNYERDNCRWATVRDQQNNRRYTVMIEHRGIKKSLSEWADESGMSIDTLYNRIHKLKWSAEKSINTPCRPYVTG